jgi:hypothetical protein
MWLPLMLYSCHERWVQLLLQAALTTEMLLQPT